MQTIFLRKINVFLKKVEIPNYRLFNQAGNGDTISLFKKNAEYVIQIRVSSNIEYLYLFIKLLEIIIF